MMNVKKIFLITTEKDYFRLNKEMKKARFSKIEVHIDKKRI